MKLWNLSRLTATLGLAICLSSPVARAAGEAEAKPLDGGPVLTEAKFVDLALRFAPSVDAAQHDANGAQHARDAANRARLPDLTLSASYTRLSSIPERFRTLSVPFPDGTNASFAIPQLLDRYGARAALVLPLSDAWLGLAANSRALGHLADAKKIEVEATRARIAFEARAAFLLYRRARGSVRIAEAALEAATAQERDQNERVRSGTASPTTLLTFEVARSLAVSRLRGAEGEVDAAEAGVRAFLPKTMATASLSVEGNSGTPSLQRGVEASPILRAAESALAAADARVDGETLSMLPRLSLVAGGEVRAPNDRAFAMSSLVAVPAWDVTVQMDWALSSVTTGVARRAQAVEERSASRARLEEARRQLRAQREMAEATKRGADARLTAARSLRENASKLVAARRVELAAGTATPLDLTNAQADSVRAEQEAADAELDVQLAKARLAYLAGYVPGS